MPSWLPAAKSAAITGAGGGIGRALCVALAKAGARSIVALDIDHEASKETAALCAAAHPGCAVRAERCDASDGEALRAALRRAEPLDLFCANAGMGSLGDCSAPASTWAASWELNVMQAVHAADELVPAMAARGGGALLITASAAGLLQQLGSAPYSVTKHAAVGLAEWLSVSHAHQNISVVCVCPQGVRTKMAEGMMQSDAARAAGLDGLLEPETVAEDALDCLAQGRFLCMPGGDQGPARHVAKKAADRERWIGGMRRLQAKLLAAKL